jgi:phage terminase large subunit-like protein
MYAGKETLEALVALPAAKAARVIGGMGAERLRLLFEDWPSWTHEGQDIPAAGSWRTCVMLGGRGFGKTRAGAEWVRQLARDHPGARIALVAATPEEARAVMIEGRSGLIEVARPGEETIWEPSIGRLTFESGAEARVYSGAHADGLRGPEHHFAWADELAKWKQAQDAWDNLMLALRAGPWPRALVTTTPRSITALKAIIGEADTIMAGGPMRANPHLAQAFARAMEERHAGTSFGRQELDGELIDDLEGALWRRGKMKGQMAKETVSAMRVVIGVDPPASANGTCGIVVCGVDSAGIGYVLADLSAGGLSPEGWARKVAAAAEAWGARLVAAEANNGGQMVEAVLRGADVAVPVKLVHAAEGKAARAAPVATLFECGRAKFAGRFPALEEELCGLNWDGSYSGPGKSPDRADAMVWALTELMLGKRRREPSIRVL